MRGLVEDPGRLDSRLARQGEMAAEAICVHRYGKKVSQFRLARAAMEQSEAGREKLCLLVLGSVEVVE